MVLRARIQPDHGAPGDAGRWPGEDADEAPPAEFDNLLFDIVTLPCDRRGGPAGGGVLRLGRELTLTDPPQ